MEYLISAGELTLKFGNFAADAATAVRPTLSAGEIPDGDTLARFDQTWRSGY